VLPLSCVHGRAVPSSEGGGDKILVVIVARGVGGGGETQNGKMPSVKKSVCMSKGSYLLKSSCSLSFWGFVIDILLSF